MVSMQLAQAPGAGDVTTSRLQCEEFFLISFLNAVFI
jgi:hypothetical protein